LRSDPAPGKPIPPLPPAFLARMQRLLGDDYQDFMGSYDTPPVSGLRVNSLKLSPQDFCQLAPFELVSLPWCQSGFSLPEDRPETKRLGKHAWHAAGLYYLQEPSAMAVAEILAPQPDELVLDLSAAPGGKATHLASLMQNQGVLVANEIHPQRVWDLAENLERWGCRNAVITNATPEQLSEQWEGLFDRVLVDAPCSGEGLFRRQLETRRVWNADLVTGCALRQGKILQSAGQLVRPGGRLVYSTCTFSPEENEAVIDGFLDKNPHFKLAAVPEAPGFSPGRPEWTGSQRAELQATVHLWPHRISGEGHFIALLERADDGQVSPPEQFRLHPPVKEALANFTAFQKTTFTQLPGELRLHQQGDQLYHVPQGAPEIGRLRAVRPGWWLGTFKKGRFEPSHALALGIARHDVQRSLELDPQGTEVQLYLSGETLPSPGEAGWVLVTVNGFSLGWGKRVQGVLKNYYPRGLRWV
jgi:NOL1/NOP2/sun family putative RNA methylase